MAAVNSNGLYTDNEDTNRGVFKASEVMTGVLNQDVAGNGNNYPANSFLNAYTGSLLLIVNDATASTLSLADLNSTNNLSSNTGFSVGAELVHIVLEPLSRDPDGITRESYTELEHRIHKQIMSNGSLIHPAPQMIPLSQLELLHDLAETQLTTTILQV